MGAKGSGGHNRKSAAQKRIEGNRGKRPINKREPIAVAADPSIPDDLSALERTFWQQLFPIVSDMQVMTVADVTALTQLCRFLAEERECSTLLNKMGRLIPKKNSDGQILGVTLNPIARLRSDAAKHVRGYLSVFGLGPSFRAGLSVNPESPSKPVGALDSVLHAKSASDEIVH
jgi:P27 family predicted phage terminase small subunit